MYAISGTAISAEDQRLRRSTAGSHTAVLHAALRVGPTADACRQQRREHVLPIAWKYTSTTSRHHAWELPQLHPPAADERDESIGPPTKKIDARVDQPNLHPSSSEALGVQSHPETQDALSRTAASIARASPSMCAGQRKIFTKRGKQLKYRGEHVFPLLSPCADDGEVVRHPCFILHAGASLSREPLTPPRALPDSVQRGHPQTRRRIERRHMRLFEWRAADAATRIFLRYRFHHM